MNLSAAKKQIAFFLYYTVTQQSSKIPIPQAEKWKQAIRFFTEYSTVERLEERTERCMPVLSPTQATKTICAIVVTF